MRWVEWGRWISDEDFLLRSPLTLFEIVLDHFGFLDFRPLEIVLDEFVIGLLVDRHLVLLVILLIYVVEQRYFV